jgi:hypothetical protein
MAHRGGKQAAGVKQRITKAHAERFEAIKSLGCLACRKLNLPMFCGPIEAHHLLSGGRRRGHDQCIPLGKWHHQGIPWQTLTSRQMNESFGPSLANGSKPFHAMFGSDDELLAEVERLIA